VTQNTKADERRTVLVGEERIDRADVVLSGKGSGETFQSLLQRRISRRGVLKAGVAAGAIVLANPLTGKLEVGTPVAARGAPNVGGSVAFAPVPPQPEDAQQVVVAEGYSWAPFIRWGDPIRAGGPAYDPANLSAWAQEQQVGYNCDYIGYHPLPFHARRSPRGLLWINHEYTNGELMWSDYENGNPTREQADIELAAHGGSVIEVIRDQRGALTVDAYSPYNRRITGTTPIRASGPAVGHEWMRTSHDPLGDTILGMLNNCAGGITPWGTVLTCEENFQGYFGGVAAMSDDDPRKAVHERYGLADETSGYGWEQHHGRFSVAYEPNEPFRFGWVVEIDPYDPESTPVKRTALGRFRHEGATFGHSPSGRVVFYSGDDQRFEYIYKYVSDEVWHPIKRGMGQRLLDDGVLYVAKYNEDGSGEWLPLVYGENGLDESNGFTSQGDVLIKTRLAADVLGATKMDRPEDIQQNPFNHRIYAALTNNSQREEGDTDAANPRPENRTGHVIEIEEADGDAASTTFSWDIFLLCGDPGDESTYFAGYPKELVSPIACPDNVNFDHDGNLWISTDGQPAPLGIADGLYAVPTDGPQRGRVAQFLSVVSGAECASFEFVHDFHNLVVAVQHPGEGGTVDEPILSWPDGGLNRPTVIQVWKNDRRRINS
jgi:secreted PhoX family phosphatase